VSETGGVVAVWDLDDMSPGLARETLGELFAAQVMDVLKNKGEYTVVERARLLRVLEELRLGSSSLVDEQTRMRLGKLVGARLMVFGGYQVIGGQMRVDLRLVEVETGKVVKAVQKTATTPDMTGRIDAVRKAAEEL
jgi:curli biogenesis system outer membrane secretion channel CsgG